MKARLGEIGQAAYAVQVVGVDEQQAVVAVEALAVLHLLRHGQETRVADRQGDAAGGKRHTILPEW